MQERTSNLIRSTLVAVLLLAATAIAADRPSLYGFAPAYPADTLPVFTSERNSPYTAYERLVRVELTVGEDGSVERGRPATAADSLYYRHVADYCALLRFVPATSQGKPVVSVLPVDIAFAPRSDRPEFVFPVSREGRITALARYLAVFPLNDIQPPEVTVFPRYFAKLNWSDSSRQYPFVLMKLSLDAEGAVTALEPVHSTLPSVTRTTMSAALWADLEPLRVKGKAQAAECFLLVSYFPQVMYPTQPWVAAAADTMPPLERWRVRLLPDTTGAVLPPLVRRLPGTEIEVPGASTHIATDTIGALFAIDTLGALHVQRSDARRGNLSTAMRSLTRKVTFYPAMTVDGRPQPYRGWAWGTGTPSGRLRMECVW